MPPRARGIGAAWGGKKGGGHRVGIEPRDDGHTAFSSLCWLGATIVAPIGQDQRQVQEVYLIVVVQVAKAARARSVLVENEQDVSKIHNEIAVGITNTISLTRDAVRVNSAQSFDF